MVITEPSRHVQQDTALLTKAKAAGFEVLATTDKNLDRPISVKMSAAQSLGGGGQFSEGALVSSGRRYSRTIMIGVENSVECVAAIRTGDIDLLNRILEENPVLVQSRVDGQRTLLHVATDWPGHFPNVRASVSALVSRGADVNAAFAGGHSEKPLHWAASSDDVDALDALLDHGAHIEATGGVIGGGTPLADAVAFGQWRAAHRLVERGARTTLWQAAALGLNRRVEECFTSNRLPAPDDITNAFWCACHGGQLSAAQFLFDRGADLNWVGYDGLSALDVASRSGALDLVKWLREQGARSARVPT